MKSKVKTMHYIKTMPNLPLKAEAILPQRKRLGFLFTLAMLLFAGNVAATELSSALQQHIAAELQQYLKQLQLNSTAQPDISLTLPAAITNASCSQLSISRRQQHTPPLGRISYTLKCTAPQRWQSRAVAQIQLYLPLVVASRTLQRDEIINADMLSLADIELSTLRHDPELQPEPLLGMTVKRRINAGEPLHRAMLQLEYLVEKGSRVKLLVQGQGFEVSTEATALADGQLGERIRVENLTSGKIVEVVVSGKNTVVTGHK